MADMAPREGHRALLAFATKKLAEKAQKIRERTRKNYHDFEKRPVNVYELNAVENPFERKVAREIQDDGGSDRAYPDAKAVDDIKKQWVQGMKDSEILDRVVRWLQPFD